MLVAALVFWSVKQRNRRARSIVGGRKRPFRLSVQPVWRIAGQGYGAYGVELIPGFPEFVESAWLEEN